MEYIFMDNFRGFKETIVPIGRVNFLVGENSTGKSSFLSLFSILCDDEFLFSPSFVKLGSFDDIISASSPDKSFFSVGRAQRRDNPQSEGGGDEEVTLWTFCNEDGLPSIRRYAHFHKGQLLSIIVDKDAVRWGTFEVNKDLGSEEKFISYVRLLYSKEILDRDGHLTLLKEGQKFRGSIWPILSTIQTQLDAKFSNLINIEKYFRRRRDVVDVAPIRTKPRRTYDGYKVSFSSEGDHSPYILKKMLENKETTKKFNRMMQDFGKLSGLFSKIQSHSFGKKGTSAPFEVKVKLKGKPALNINNVGYGVSQVLPVIVEMLARGRNAWFVIQQPEVHLHPRAQAALGGLIFSFMKEYEQRYLIETHSDYLIDHFRYQMKKNAGVDNVQVLFFERDSVGNKVYNISIFKNGQYALEQPKAFREFFIKEELRILEI